MNPSSVRIVSCEIVVQACHDMRAAYRDLMKEYGEIPSDEDMTGIDATLDEAWDAVLKCKAKRRGISMGNTILSPEERKKFNQEYVSARTNYKCLKKCAVSWETYKDCDTFFRSRWFKNLVDYDFSEEDLPDIYKRIAYKSEIPKFV